MQQLSAAPSLSFSAALAAAVLATSIFSCTLPAQNPQQSLHSSTSLGEEQPK
jgi:hypothetical protein